METKDKKGREQKIKCFCSEYGRAGKVAVEFLRGDRGGDVP